MKSVEVRLDLSKLEKLARDLREPCSVKIGVIGPKAMSRLEVKKLGDPEKDYHRAKLSSITLAGIATVQEFGSIKHNIPKRSFLKEPIQENLPKRLGEIKIDFQNISNTYEKLGILAKTIVLEAFDTSFGGRWLKNAEITLEGGWMRNKVSGKIFRVWGKDEFRTKQSGESRPLILSGHLRKSIAYRIDRNG